MESIVIENSPLTTFERVDQYALKRLNSGSLLIYIWNGVKWIIHFLSLLKQPPRCHWISEKIHIVLRDKTAGSGEYL